MSNLPEGLDTQVGERGVRLSGGEKQRVGIARMVLKNPGILLLDEATSALDTETERSIQAALRQVSEGKTAMMVAHRLSTIKDADEIVVLEKGSVIERGTHKQLLALQSKYHALWNDQQRAHEEQADSTHEEEEDGADALTDKDSFRTLGEVASLTL